MINMIRKIEQKFFSCLQRVMWFGPVCLRQAIYLISCCFFKVEGLCNRVKATLLNGRLCKKIKYLQRTKFWSFIKLEDGKSKDVAHAKSTLVKYSLNIWAKLDPSWRMKGHWIFHRQDHITGEELHSWVGRRVIGVFAAVLMYLISLLLWESWETSESVDNLHWKARADFNLVLFSVWTSEFTVLCETQ